MTDFSIENFRATRATVGFVARFDCRLADGSVWLSGLSLKRPEKSPNELWLFLPTIANNHTDGVRAYHIVRDLCRAIGEGAAAKYRASTGVDAHYVAPPRRPSEASCALHEAEANDDAGVRRVLGAVEETMVAAGL